MLDQGELTRLRNAMSNYAVGRGWPTYKAEDGLTLPGSVFADEGSGDGAILKSAMKLLQAGDILLLPDIKSISMRPSVQQETILSLLGRGVKVHVLSLSGPVDNHLLALREAWEATLPIERERDAIERRAALREKQIEKEQEAYATELTARMAERFGVKNLWANEATPETQLGTYIRTNRERLGWTQDQLAHKARSSKAAISRMEREGKGDAIPAVLEALRDTRPAAEAIQPTIGA
jgi:DNA-binding XRE family transcriptional regulator